MKTTTHKPRRFARSADIPKTYRELCQLYLPRPIRDDQENREATEMMNGLAVFERLNAEQNDYLDVLIEFVDAVKTSERTSEPRVSALFDAAVEHLTAIRRNLIAKLKGERRPSDPGQTESDKWDKDLLKLALTFLGDTATRLDVGNSFHLASPLTAEATAEQVRIALLDYLLKLVTDNLVRMADSGNADAIRLLAATAIDFVKQLNELAGFKRHVNALLPFSRRSEVWPVLLSLNAAFNKNEAGVIGSLQLAQGLERNFSANAKWSHKTMAAFFWKEIDDVRIKYRGKIAPSSPALSKEQVEAFLKELARPTFKPPVACEDRADLANSGNSAVLICTLSKEKTEFVRKALALPTFNQPGASKQWADLAKERVVAQMKMSKDFHTLIIAKLPKSKQKRGWQGRLTTEFRRKFANMSQKYRDNVSS